MVQQSKAFLIRHRGEGVVWVDILQVGDQVSQRVVGSKGVHLSDDTDR